MFRPLQNCLENYQRRDGDEHDESAIPVRRVKENTYHLAWRNLSVRNMWITTGTNPAVYGLKRAEMQAPLASDETMVPLSSFKGFRVAAYMAEGFDARLAADKFLPEQMQIFAEAVLAVVRNGALHWKMASTA